LRTDVLFAAERSDIDFEALIQQLLIKLDDFNRRGSGWQLGQITNCTLSIAAYRPLLGSSYIRTPKNIVDKHAIVNVKNLKDNLCFVWSVLAHLHPAKHHPDRLTNYEHFLHEINVKDLVFPLSLKQIPKFESLNPTIRITVLAYDDDEKDFIPLYVSPHHNRQHQVNLLLLTDGDKHHYTLIRNMSRLVAGRTKHEGKNYVCEYCLHPCSSKNFYDRHILECSAHSPQRVLYPEEGSTLEWTEP
jgi:hypothetical protein